MSASICVRTSRLRNAVKSECASFSTSATPHFNFRPRTDFPPTECFCRPQIVENGILLTILVLWIVFDSSSDSGSMVNVWMLFSLIRRIMRCLNSASSDFVNVSALGITGIKLTLLPNIFIVDISNGDKP
eukprot:NODE_136_length_18060_cov_0.656645.p14 type:complete len:130 gc:universal NODE_136_length_18060_cov_0.656645:4899-4510(-)